MESYKHGELAKEILKGLANASLLVACLAMPGLTKIIPLFNPTNPKEKYRVDRTIKTLHKKRLINIYLKNGNEVVEITKAGKRKVLEYNLNDMKIMKSAKWDGWWRIVMFDIPESKKVARGSVSRKIKGLGMYPIQKSVFISPYRCKNEIDFIGEFFDVRDHIVYLKAKEIEGVKILKDYFEVS